MTPPVIDRPCDVTRTTSDYSGVRVRFRVRASNDRDGRLRVRCDPRSGSVFEVATTRVTCTAHDSNEALPVTFDIVVDYQPVVD